MREGLTFQRRSMSEKLVSHYSQLPRLSAFRFLFMRYFLILPATFGIAFQDLSSHQWQQIQRKKYHFSGYDLAFVRLCWRIARLVRNFMGLTRTV